MGSTAPIAKKQQSTEPNTPAKAIARGRSRRMAGVACTRSTLASSAAAGGRSAPTRLAHDERHPHARRVQAADDPVCARAGEAVRELAARLEPRVESLGADADGHVVRFI